MPMPSPGICPRSGCFVQLIDGVCPRCNPQHFKAGAGISGVALTDAEVAAKAMETVRQVGPPAGVPFVPIAPGVDAAAAAGAADQREAELEEAFERVAGALESQRNQTRALEARVIRLEAILTPHPASSPAPAPAAPEAAPAEPAPNAG